jgi:hypothetical protein
VLTEGNNVVTVLLATYNSEAFLQEQLQSIICSVPRPASIIVSDDNSTDATKSILEAAEPECRSKNIQLRVYDNSAENKGVHGNFQQLLALGLASDSDIFLLCDHDDIWRDTKMAKCLSALGALEDESVAKSAFPALVFSDLEVMSEAGETISPSFAQFQGLPDPKEHPLESLLHNNVVTGCTACFNRALLEVATPIPDVVVMHDHWLGLCAKVFGDWYYIDEPLVRYRQHGSNAVGAKRDYRSGFDAWLGPVFLTTVAIFPWHFAQSIQQAQALLMRVKERRHHVSETKLEIVREFCRLLTYGPIKRISEGVKWVSTGRGLPEKIYLTIVLCCLPYLRVRKVNDSV